MDLATHIRQRAALASSLISEASIKQFVLYLELLARWNRKINLTALAVNPPTDEAIDRLLIEPFAAAQFVSPSDRQVVDLGSGGGSPALPFHVEHPHLVMVMVESRSRKCAFLREAVRQLGLTCSRVENGRYETICAQPELKRSTDIVTIRAIRLDQHVIEAASSLLREGGRIFQFSQESMDSAESSLQSPRLHLLEAHPLVVSRGSRLRILSVQ